MNKTAVLILTLALSGSVAFAQGGRGGMGGNRGGNRGGNQGGAPGQNQNAGGGAEGGAAMGGMGQQGGGFGGFGGQQGGRGGRGGMGGFGGQQGGQQGGRGGRGGMGGFGGGDMEGMEGMEGFGGGFGGMGQGGFGGMGQGGFGGMGQGGFGGMGQGGFGGMGGMDFGGGFGGMGQQPGRGNMGPGAMGGGRVGQLQQTIDRLKAETPREQALKKMEETDKDAYAKIQKGIEDVNAQLAALAQKAEVVLPDTTEQQKARTLEFLVKEKDTIDKLLETDKTDSATAMRSFNELAQKNKIVITPDFGRGGAGGVQPDGQAAAQGGTRANNNVIRQIQEKFPDEYKKAAKLRDSDPYAYRDAMLELKKKLNSPR